MIWLCPEYESAICKALVRSLLAAHMFKKHVFISYCDENRRDVSQLRDELITAGESVWWSQDIKGGQDWQYQIQEAMKAAYAVVACFSRESEARVTSGIYPELRQAFDMYCEYATGAIFLIPVRLSECKIPSIRIDGTRSLDALQHIDLYPEAWRTARVTQLLEAIRTAPYHPASRESVVATPATRVSSVPRVEEKRQESSTRIDVAKPVWHLSLPPTSRVLVGREHKLKKLERCWDNHTTNLVTVVGCGGIGKTAFVNQWLNRLHRDGYRGATDRYEYSFQGQGAENDLQTSEPFLEHALESFGDPCPREGSAESKGDRLACLLRGRRALLILDGVEVLQDLNDGSLKDPGLLRLLLGLVTPNMGLCVLTTHKAIHDLKSFEDGAMVSIDLLKLPAKAGAEYLSKLMVRGEQKELEDASDEFGGHPLALTLLGELLVTHFEGYVRRRSEIPPLKEASQNGKEARRVMRFYERKFAGQVELGILRMMGLFDRPAEIGAVDALRENPVPGLNEGISANDWSIAVQHLTKLRLLDKNERVFDSHPLIREHFGEEFKTFSEGSWKDAHSRLYEYYRAAAPQFPKTLQQMNPLLAAVAHGCHSGRYQETYDNVYQKRIRRGEQAVLTKELGAFGENLAAVGCFFESRWEKPVMAVTEGTKAFLLNQAGYSLRALGLFREAVEPIAAGLRAYKALHNFREAAVVAGNLSELHLVLGGISKAVEYARQSVEFADKSELEDQKWSKRTTLADAYHRMGDTETAASLFIEAEELAHKRLTQLWGFRYCDLLVDRNAFEDVLKRAEAALEFAQRIGRPLDIGLDHLSLARAYYGLRKSPEASQHFDMAVESLRKAGFQEYLVVGLLHRAAFQNSEGDLNEALERTIRCGMRLYEADCYLLRARIHNDVKSVTNAREIIDQIGYGRRYADVLALEQWFGA